MSELQTQTLTRPAKLDTGSGDPLCGALSRLADGTLRMSSLQSANGDRGEGTLNLQPGQSVSLTIDNLSDARGAVDGIQVCVGNIISPSTISLEFKDPENELAQRYTLALGSGQSDASANVSAVAADGSEALQAFQAQSLNQLEEFLGQFLFGLSDHLSRPLEDAGAGSPGSESLGESMSLVQQNRQQIIAAVLERVEQGFQNLAEPEVEESPREVVNQSADDLNLLSIDELEQDLAIDRMISTGEQQHNIALETLVIRLADLTNIDPLNMRLPVHVKQICQAFTHALEHQGISLTAIPHVHEYFTSEFISKLDNYYAGLNSNLIERGIQPTAEQEIEDRGSILSRARSARNSSQRAAAPPVEAPPPAPQENAYSAEAGVDLSDYGASQEAHTGDHSSADQRYQSVLKALNFQRDASGMTMAGNARGGQMPGATLAPTQGGASAELASAGAATLAAPVGIASIAGALEALQQNSSARASIGQSASLREYLAANPDSIGGDIGRGLAPQSLNQLDLIDNLFGTIKSQLDVTAELQPALGNLHIPLAKLALLEPQFFTDSNHSARGLLDKLAQLATTANFPNNALEGQIQRIVDQVVTEYDQDSTVFDTALNSVDKLITQQTHTLTRNIDRVVSRP
ncbi:MAG: DUF1631 family protein [Halieaceae bacterium]|nr:DUF1631 family protein [Halieaceae bacterium]